MKASSPVAVLGLALSLLVLTASASAANKPRPTIPDHASCRTKSGAICKGTTIGHVCYRNGRPIACSPAQTTTGGTTTTTASKPKPAPPKPTTTPTTTTQQDPWPYDGSYAGTETIHVHGPAVGSAAPLDTTQTAPINFVVAHGTSSLFQGAISNAGQASVVVSVPGSGALGATLFFVLGGNGSVQVDGQIQGQFSSGGAVLTVSGFIKASRISR